VVYASDSGSPDTPVQISASAIRVTWSTRNKLEQCETKCFIRSCKLNCKTSFGRELTSSSHNCRAPECKHKGRQQQTDEFS